MSRKKSKKATGTALIRSSAAEYLTFVAASGDSETSVEIRYEDENIWLTQKMMGLLYDVDVRTISYHLKNVFSDNELQEDSISCIRHDNYNASSDLWKKHTPLDVLKREKEGLFRAVTTIRLAYGNRRPSFDRNSWTKTGIRSTNECIPGIHSIVHI